MVPRKPAASRQPSQAEIRGSQRQSAAAFRARQRAQAPPRAQQRQVAGRAAAGARTAAVPPATDYQKVIAAEFVAASLLVALTPIATRPNTPGLSPYVTRDMSKLLGIGLLYFVLELTAIPSGWGRVSAWLGGLVLLTVGLNEATNIVRDLDLLAGIRFKGSGDQGGLESGNG